jgi:hypothetical protein
VAGCATAMRTGGGFVNTADVFYASLGAVSFIALGVLGLLVTTATRSGYKATLSLSYGPAPQPKPSPVTPHVPAQRESADGGRM